MLDNNHQKLEIALELLTEEYHEYMPDNDVFRKVEALLQEVLSSENRYFPEFNMTF